MSGEAVIIPMDHKEYLHDWFAPLLGMAILAILGYWNYLAFHFTAEFFTATVGVVTFVIAINTWRFTHNSFLYIFGVGSASVAVMGLLHALAYKGMNIIPGKGNDANLPTKLWLDGRYLEAATLLLSVLALKRRGRWSPRFIFFGFGIATVLLCWATFAHWFPAAWRPGEGLTHFKIGSEYLVIAIYIAVLLLLYRNRRLLSPHVSYRLAAAVMLMAVTELCFTLYADVYGVINMLGHYAMFLAFWQIYLAIVRSTLRQPFAALSAGARTFDAIPSPVFVINGGGDILHANRAAAIRFGGSGIDLEEQGIFALPLAFPDSVSSGKIKAIADDGEELKEIIHSQEGEGYSMSMVPVSWAGSAAAAVLTLTDITPTLQAQAKLQALSLTDVLTGVANRRALTDRLHEEFQRKLRYKDRPLSLLMLDLDHFKRINDTYGHAAGDAVLCHFADLLKRELRRHDILARVGGEEFAVLLPETGLNGALQFAERLRRIVSASEIGFEGEMLRVTTSIGVATISPEDKDPFTMFKRADAALYRAKERGRNRVDYAEMHHTDSGITARSAL